MEENETASFDVDLQFISKQTNAVNLALRKLQDLWWPDGYNKKPKEDIFDWLQAIFGFQNDSVANQREHLTMLLINSNIQHCPSGHQLDDISVREVMKKVLRSSDDWCEFMNLKDRKFSLRKQEKEGKQWCNLLFTGLYLLIWGEAANLRFMPECLSYIYHKMAEELWVILEEDGGCERKLVEEETILKNVVTPIYDVIRKEQEWCNWGKSTHSQWRNYDDLNEYFWSGDCFQLDWPLNTDAKFFSSPLEELCQAKKGENKPAQNEDKWTGKVNFVEIRSFCHIFRSFDRMWSFFILALQAMVIVAFNGRGNPRAIFEINVFKRVLSIFITSSVMKFGLALLDVVLDWKARKTMTYYVKLRYTLKVVYGAAWAVILLVTYAYLWENPSLYYWAAGIYLFPYMLSAISFGFPFIRSSLEKSDYKVALQPRLFVGREMHESAFSVFKYTLYWVVLIIVKLGFSYYIEILPLVSPTKTIMQFHVTNFKWNDFFSHDQHNIGVVISLWAPIILVYFLDIQIWYAVFSAVIGFIYGACCHLGEIRSLGMLRSRFESSYDKLYERLISKVETKHQKINHHKEKATSHLWNKIITSMSEEDLISKGEVDLLLVPYWVDGHVKGIRRWPLFLLANKISTALEMAQDPELIEGIKLDDYMFTAVRECYASFKGVIYRMVKGDHELYVIGTIFDTINNDLKLTKELVNKYQMSALASLRKHFLELITFLLNNNGNDRGIAVHVFLDMLRVLIRDIMRNNVPERAEVRTSGELFMSEGAIEFPIPIESMTDGWKEKIKRLHLLLTMESAMDVPLNKEARRRLTFFSNSLFMNMPSPPLVRKMLSFSVLTPHDTEDVLFSSEDLATQNEDGVSIQFYLKKIFPDEWRNFVERVNCENERDLRNSGYIRLWSSYRGQTLFRTVRGIMYYRKALELQAFLDEANETVFKEGHRAFQLNTEENSDFIKFCRAIVDMKFTYVVSCQQYGMYKRSGDPRAQDIMKLMTTYPSLRVAYVDEDDRSKKTNNKVYFSVLAKAALPAITNSEGHVQYRDQDIYRIKLPGRPILGERKPENQNHAIIFTRGEGLQTIDMNQDYYMEEALKMRNLLEEFRIRHGGMRYPTILGLREHIFTGSVSSVARLMSNQELSFVTIGQRFLANPLKVRFHYGHPDVFDRLFHLTRGGVSKASKVINLSEDIFAGFNSTLRGGNITHHEYIQVGKGSDLGFDKISMFESKIACGNGELTISRDLYRLGHCFDFFRMLSLYYTTVGFYFSTLITVLAVYIFLYGRLYLVLSGLDVSFNNIGKIHNNKVLQVALAPLSLVQIGFLLVLPMLMEIGLEKGFSTALSEFFVMNLQLAPVFFAFSMGTKIHYYGRTLLHGGVKYRPTGQGFVVYHTKFADIYKLYSRSHFVKAIELMILLTVCEIFGQPYRSKAAYMLTNMSTWFMVGTWLFAPFVFNPSGFEWHNILNDWCEWNKWISNSEESGVALDKSWEWWWKEEQEHLHHSGFIGIVAEILLSLRFFIYQYGLVCHLKLTENTKSFLVYALSWSVILVMVFVMKMVSVGRQLSFRVIRWLIFLMVVVILHTLYVLLGITLQDILVCILAFMSAGWGLLQVAQALSPAVKKAGLWRTVTALARGYEIVMGLLLFTPVAILAFFPFVSDFQTRILFNQAFSRSVGLPYSCRT